MLEMKIFERLFYFKIEDILIELLDKKFITRPLEQKRYAFSRFSGYFTEFWCNW